MSDSVNCTGEISRISSLVLGILNGVSGFAAITGNFLVLMTFIKNQSLREPSYYFMTSLATVDLLVGLVVNPFYVAITNFVSWQYREERLLQLESFLAMTASTIIMHSLTVMSVERFIAVNYPLRYRSLVTEKRSCIAIASVWTFGLSFNSAFFATSNDVDSMWSPYWTDSNDNHPLLLWKNFTSCAYSVEAYPHRRGVCFKFRFVRRLGRGQQASG